MIISQNSNILYARSLRRKARTAITILATGKDSEGIEKSFVVFSSKELLKKMKESGIESCTILPGDLDNEVIEIRRVTLDDVERMIRNGEI